MNCYIYNNVTLNEEQLIQKIKYELDNNPKFEDLSAIVYKEATLTDKVDEFAKKSAPYIENKKHEYISVSKFITAVHMKNGKRDGQLTPKMQEDSRRAEYIKQHLSDFGGDANAAAVAFNEQIQDEQWNSKVGDWVHKFTQILLEKGSRSAEYAEAYKELADELKDNDYAFAKSITSEDKSIKFDNTSKQLDVITKQAKRIADWVTKTFPNREKIYCELPMLLKANKTTNFACIDVYGNSDTTIEYKGIVGKADLVVVDKDGKIHIVDYKVSCRPYAEWIDAKLNEVDYQLCLYRGMLEAGINVDPAKITLHVKPMTMKKQQLSTLQEETRYTGEESIDLLKSGAGGSSRVAVNGKFSQNLREYGIGARIQMPHINDSELKSLIDDDWGKVIGYTADPKILTKQEFIDKQYLKPDLGSKGEILGWKFFDKLSGTSGKWVKNSNKEDFTKDGGLIDEYLVRLKQNRNDVLKTIVQEISEQKRKPTKNFTFLRSDNRPERAALLQQYLGKYIEKNWEYVGDTIPELADHGILLFQKITDQGPIIEAVVLTDINLNMRVPINGHQTILGKYFDDNEANHLTIKPLDNQYKNVKALETISVLNTIATKFPGHFKGAALNRVVILNPLGSVDPVIDATELNSNFDLLCQKSGLVNQFNNSDSGIKTSEPYESLMTDLQDIISQVGEDDTLGHILTKLDGTQITLAQKREAVYNILVNMRHRFPQIAAFKDLTSKRAYNTNDPVIASYLIISQMYNFLNGQKISYDGRISRWGVNINEAFQLLGLPINGLIAKTDSKGDKMVGFAGGLEISSPRTTPSSTLQQLFAYYDIAFNNVRKDYFKQINYIEKISKDYIKNFHGNVSELIAAGNVEIWEHLLIHDADGKVNKDMMIKNPWGNTDLTELDKQYLKEILWEINKYRLVGLTEEQRFIHYKGHEHEIDSLDAVKNAKDDESYFMLPLSRADNFQKWLKRKDFGWKNYYKAKWEEFKDNHDPRQLHQERAKQIDSLDHTEMYNEYAINRSERQHLLEMENNPYNFLFDLDFLSADVAFQYIRKSHFDKALMLTETVVAMMHLKQQEENVDMTTEIEVASDQSKISLSGKPVISEDAQNLSQVAGAMKYLNSIALLAFRPLQFVKELTFGQFTNYSRAWALKYGSNKLNFDSVFKANKMIWGQQLGKYGSAFLGQGSLADFTMCEAINKLYGIANEDLNRVVENSTLQRVGIANNFSRWMYIANSAPDYFNRLTLFIAKMIEDGCLDAHSLDAEGNLKYDWKKDKRFNILAKYGLNTNNKDKEYLKQKALYVKMCEEFEKGGEELIVWDPNKKQYIYKDITQCYTSNQRASIKEVSDMAYGYYDHEAKSILNHKLFGLIFLQFQTFMSAKLNLWFKAPTNRGGNTAQGKFVEMVRNGEVQYRRIITDDAGNIIRTDIIPESQLTEDEKGILLPQMEWQGDYIEGLFYSIGGMLYDIFHLNWKNLANDKQRLANVKLAMHDLLIGIILFTILKYIFSNGSNKLKDIHPTERILLRAMNDVSPAALTQLSLNPSFVQTWTNLKNDGVKMLFHGQGDIISIMENRFGAAKDFIWED